MQKYKTEFKPVTENEYFFPLLVIYAIMSDVFQICLSTCSKKYEGLEMTYSIEFIIQDDSSVKIIFVYYVPKEYTLVKYYSFI